VPFEFRIGEGWDVHALVDRPAAGAGRRDVPHTHGLLGHSDADALLHAITDALLGAAGSATSAGTSPTPIRRSPAPTRPCCWRARSSACAAPGG
jgi:hypothetical protein